MFACQVIPSEFGVRGLGGRHIRPPAPLPNPQEAAPRAPPTFLFLLSRSSGLLYLRRAAGAACSSRARRAASWLAAVDCPRGRRKLVRAAENIEDGVACHGRGELEHHRLALAEYDHPQDHRPADAGSARRPARAIAIIAKPGPMRVLSRLSPRDHDRRYGAAQSDQSHPAKPLVSRETRSRQRLAPLWAPST
jgi:hypothetical protein